MQGDYIDAIIRAYRNMAALHPRFSKLSRVGLKNHCKAICEERFDQRDEIILRTFFGAADGKKGYLRIIGNCSADRFRPLVSILKGDRDNPRQEYLEVLAWMFDIQPRPYNDKADYTSIATEQKVPDSVSILGSTNSATTNDHNFPIQSSIKKSSENELIPSEKPEWRWKPITVVMLVVIAGLVVFAFLKGGEKSDECMYWVGDHFEPTSCIQRGGDTIVVAMDVNRLRNFRRIKDTSSITENSIGKVWYRKSDKEYEFYTSAGKHPTDVQIGLRRLTKDSYAKFKESQIK